VDRPARIDRARFRRAGSAWLPARGKDRATPIPFGPYLAAAGFIQLLWGRELLEKWLGFYPL
jgi:leader peptidase (prepilin peptidase)/N-methyltransferase